MKMNDDHCSNWAVGPDDACGHNSSESRFLRGVPGQVARSSRTVRARLRTALNAAMVRQMSVNV